MRMTTVYFAGGAIQYSLSRDAGNIMDDVETIQSFNLNGDNSQPLTEVERHRLFISADDNADRTISLEEANFEKARVSNRYEDSLGLPSEGPRQRRPE